MLQHFEMLLATFTVVATHFLQYVQNLLLFSLIFLLLILNDGNGDNTVAAVVDDDDSIKAVVV
jgi:hypothetical protein